MAKITKVAICMILAVSAMPAVAQVPVGGSIGPNPFGVDMNWQLAMPDGSGGYNPGIEIGSGVVAPGGSIQVPNSADLCGVEVRLVVWDNGTPPTVFGPMYITLTCN